MHPHTLTHCFNTHTHTQINKHIYLHVNVRTPTRAHAHAACTTINHNNLTAALSPSHASSLGFPPPPGNRHGICIARSSAHPTNRAAFISHPHRCVSVRVSVYFFSENLYPSGPPTYWAPICTAFVSGKRNFPSLNRRSNSLYGTLYGRFGVSIVSPGSTSSTGTCAEGENILNIYF